MGTASKLLKAKSKDANPDDGLQGHTCYSNLGALGYDQTFDTEMFADGTLYMKNFDVCVTLESTDSGSLLALTECDGSDSQSFNFSGEGTITPTSAPDKCFTLAEATRSGRSDTNQLKVLSLEKCADSSSAYQTWAVRRVKATNRFMTKPSIVAFFNPGLAPNEQAVDYGNSHDLLHAICSLFKTSPPVAAYHFANPWVIVRTYV